MGLQVQWLLGDVQEASCFPSIFTGVFVRGSQSAGVFQGAQPQTFACTVCRWGWEEAGFLPVARKKIWSHLKGCTGEPEIAQRQVGETQAEQRRSGHLL